MAEIIPLKREVTAVQIPSGEKMVLPKDLRVQVMQTLGGSFSVTTQNGYMVRINGVDADALGLEVPKASETDESAGAIAEGDVKKSAWNMMKCVYDPEIPVNIVDLGLVYDCTVSDGKDGKTVHVKMTMTAAGCGMGDVLKADAEDKIGTIPGVKHVDVEIVWEPPWDQSMMSEAARLELGMM